MGPHHWKRSPADNGFSDPNADVRPGRFANTVLGSIRGLMATAAAARDDGQGGLLAKLGAGNVYSVTTNEGLVDIATGINGVPAAITAPFLLRVAFDTALTGTTGTGAAAPHLVADNVDCGPIQRRDGSALIDGDLVKGRIVTVLGDMALPTDTKVTRVRLLDETPGELAAAIAAAQPAQTSLLQRVVFRDIKPSGQGGGYIRQQQWQTRDLNTLDPKDDPSGQLTAATPWVALGTNQFTIRIAGIYDFEIWCPAEAVDGHIARLQDVTNNVTIRNGNFVNGTASVGQNGDVVTGFSRIKGTMTVAANTTFEVQHYAQTAGNVGPAGTWSLGTPSSYAGLTQNENYTFVALQKLSA